MAFEPERPPFASGLVGPEGALAVVSEIPVGADKCRFPLHKPDLAWPKPVIDAEVQGACSDHGNFLLSREPDLLPPRLTERHYPHPYLNAAIGWARHRIGGHRVDVRFRPLPIAAVDVYVANLSWHESGL